MGAAFKFMWRRWRKSTKSRLACTALWISKSCIDRCLAVSYSYARAIEWPELSVHDGAKTYSLTVYKRRKVIGSIKLALLHHEVHNPRLTYPRSRWHFGRCRDVQLSNLGPDDLCERTIQLDLVIRSLLQREFAFHHCPPDRRRIQLQALRDNARKGPSAHDFRPLQVLLRTHAVLLLRVTEVWQFPNSGSRNIYCLLRYSCNKRGDVGCCHCLVSLFIFLLDNTLSSFTCTDYGDGVYRRLNLYQCRVFRASSDIDNLWDREGQNIAILERTISFKSVPTGIAYV
ncbi:uncharacterized protein EV420DRAFT_255633 [Desarmillaria tabescens]|uniref:Uncharacterized protein n=1 Tax=Armillaria tabescens TaxID=1929756 RepID=A0AA39N6Z6_ARMTA|nr:uncharacterized protein EV420DRAFT_255633 [Desarmillaria tabescens]KAK0460217.1 hypothetical protein EV420DRAFT_255633 [Desarmillaria tabescens]